MLWEERPRLKEQPVKGLGDLTAPRTLEGWCGDQGGRGRGSDGTVVGKVAGVAGQITALGGFRRAVKGCIYILKDHSGCQH